jgi:hypothetical protein
MKTLFEYRDIIGFAENLDWNHKRLEDRVERREAVGNSQTLEEYHYQSESYVASKDSGFADPVTWIVSRVLRTCVMEGKVISKDKVTYRLQVKTGPIVLYDDENGTDSISFPKYDPIFTRAQGQYNKRHSDIVRSKTGKDEGGKK